MEKLQVTSYSSYLINHQMAINADKSQLMVLLPPKDKSSLSIKIDDSIINHQDHIRILGVTLSATMKFDNHLWAGKKSVLKSINAKSALLKTIKPFISPQALAQVGASLINSTILYAAPLWGTTTKNNIAKIQKGQTKAARQIQRKAWQRQKIKQHGQDLMNDISWPNTQQIMISATANLTK